MKNLLANRVKTLTPSSTLAITAKAKALKEQGIDVIGLGAGEPDFNTPQNILNAAIDSMEKGFTKYTPAGGLPVLKQAIIDKLQRDNNLTYKANEIIVGVGAKHILYTLFQVILNEGDEVIIPIPYWVSYPEQVKLAGGVPVYVEGTREQGYKITADQLRAAVTDKTKAVIINSPSNPSGMIYSREELAELAAVAEEKDILIVSDEIYEKLVYNGIEHFSIAQLSAAVKARTIVVNGVAKSHSMTGWRIGYAAGNADIIKPMTDLASHSTSNATTTAQYATVEAYNGPQDTVEEMRQAFESRLEKNLSTGKCNSWLPCVKTTGCILLITRRSRGYGSYWVRFSGCICCGYFNRSKRSSDSRLWLWCTNYNAIILCYIFRTIRRGSPPY